MVPLFQRLEKILAKSKKIDSKSKEEKP